MSSEEKKGFLDSIKSIGDRIQGMKLSPKKVMLWLIIIIILVYSFGFALKPKYPPSPKDRGFKFGYRFSGGYAFIFSYQVDSGMNFVDQFDNVYSNIDIYILSKFSANYTIRVEIGYYVNATLFVSVVNVSKMVSVNSFDWAKTSIDMPKLQDRMYLAILYINNEEIVRFNYRYNIIYDRIETTIGDLLISQLIYLVIGFIIIMIGLFTAKGISQVHPLPDPELKTAGYFMIIAALILYGASKELIYTYGFASATIFYIPAYIIATFSGIYIVGQRSKRLLLLRPALESKVVEAKIIKFKEINGARYKTPSFTEFLLYKPKQLIYNVEFILEGEGIPDKVLYFKNLRIDVDRIAIEPSDIHFLELEKYKRDLKHVKILAQTVKELRDQVDSLIIRLEKGEFERDLKFLSGLIGDEPYEPEKSESSG